MPRQNCSECNPRRFSLRGLTGRDVTLDRSIFTSHGISAEAAWARSVKQEASVGGWTWRGALKANTLMCSRLSWIISYLHFLAQSAYKQVFENFASSSHAPPLTKSQSSLLYIKSLLFPVPSFPLCEVFDILNHWQSFAVEQKGNGVEARKRQVAHSSKWIDWSSCVKPPKVTSPSSI